MPVKVTSFDDPTSYPYIHDDAPGGSHGGTLDPATVTYGVNIDGSDNVNVIAVPCPFEGCGSVSYWPPGGGADALLGQSLHVIKQHEASAVRTGRAASPASISDAAEQVKQRVIDTDGEDRWLLDDQALAALGAR